MRARKGLSCEYDGEDDEENLSIASNSETFSPLVVFGVRRIVVINAYLQEQKLPALCNNVLHFIFFATKKLIVNEGRLTSCYF